VQNHGHIAELADIFASSSNQIDGEGLIGGRLSISLNGSNDAVLSGKISALTAPMSGCRRAYGCFREGTVYPVAQGSRR
jgi:hypothetical protein